MYIPESVIKHKKEREACEFSIVSYCKRELFSSTIKGLLCSLLHYLDVIEDRAQQKELLAFSEDHIRNFDPVLTGEVIMSYPLLDATLTKMEDERLLSDYFLELSNRRKVAMGQYKNCRYHSEFGDLLDFIRSEINFEDLSEKWEFLLPRKGVIRKSSQNGDLPYVEMPPLPELDPLVQLKVKSEEAVEGDDATDIGVGQLNQPSDSTHLASDDSEVSATVTLEEAASA